MPITQPLILGEVRRLIGSNACVLKINSISKIGSTKSWNRLKPNLNPLKLNPILIPVDLVIHFILRILSASWDMDISETWGAAKIFSILSKKFPRWPFWAFYKKQFQFYYFFTFCKEKFPPKEVFRYGIFKTNIYKIVC